MSTSWIVRFGIPRLAGGLALHPIALAATAVLWANDHWWKALYPGLVTGKISDLCGMIVFPLFVTGALEVCALPTPHRLRFGARGMLVVALVTGALFTAIKTWPAAAQGYRWLFGVRWLVEGWLRWGTAELPSVKHTLDPTDLVALPLLAVPVYLAWRLRPDRGNAPEPAGPSARS